MKRLLPLLLLLEQVLFLNAQVIPGSGGISENYYYSPKAFDIFPVADSEINLNTGDGGLVPYDFYAAFNCPVTHTLDSVFYAECDSVLVTIESSKPCYVIIYDLHNEQNGNYNVIKVNSIQNGTYYKSVKLYYEFWGLCRIIATTSQYVLKKAVGQAPPIISQMNIGEEVLSDISAVGSTSSSSCNISIYNYDTNETYSIGGNISNNIFYLSGSVIGQFGTTYSNAILPQEPYAVFTANSSTDVDMFLLNDSNEILGHCNNYTALSGHDWGTEARINMTGSESLNAIIILPYRSYIEQEDEYLFWGDEYSFQDSTPEGATDLYLGCKYASLTGNLSYYFPSFLPGDALVTDPIRSSAGDYNCHAWTAYPTTNCFRQPYLTGSHTASSIAYYLCNYHGFTEIGATESNSEVDIWEHLGNATHTSVKSYGGGAGGNSYGYAWESKLGHNVRVMHPRYALVNDDTTNPNAYGHVVKYLIKDPDYVASKIVYENVEFTDKERKQIAYLLGESLDEDKLYFEKKYIDVKANLVNHFVSNLEILSLYDKDYQVLVAACKKNSNLLALIFEKLSMGDALSAKLLIDATKDDYVDIVNDIISFEAKNRVDDTGNLIVRTDVSEATLYAKEILARMFNGFAEAKEGISYSNEANVMNVSSFNGRINVAFNLDKSANVSLFVEDISRGLYSISVEAKVLDQGEHEYSIKVKGKGMYVVCLEMNGQIYHKKISVNF